MNFLPDKDSVTGCALESRYAVAANDVFLSLVHGVRERTGGRNDVAGQEILIARTMLCVIPVVVAQVFHEVLVSNYLQVAVFTDITWAVDQLPSVRVSSVPRHHGGGGGR